MLPAQNKPFALEMRKHFFRRLFCRYFRRVDYNLGVGRNFVRVGNSREVLNKAGARFGVEAFAVALLADVEWCGNVDQYKAPHGLNYRSYFLAHAVVRSDGRANCNSAILRN